MTGRYIEGVGFADGVGGGLGLAEETRDELDNTGEGLDFIE